MPGVLVGCRRRDTGGGAMNIPEHPDVAAIERTGYPFLARCENKDTPESRREYIEEHLNEFLQWMQNGYPDICEEFLRYSDLYCEGYWSWLN
jgi:hypothetical protein